MASGHLLRLHQSWRLDHSRELLEGITAVIQSLRIIRPDGKRAVIAFQRLGKSPQFLEGQATIDQRLSKIRLQGEGLIIGDYCLVQALETLQRETAASMIRSVISVLLNGLADQVERHFIAATLVGNSPKEM